MNRTEFVREVRRIYTEWHQLSQEERFEQFIATHGRDEHQALWAALKKLEKRTKDLVEAYNDADCWDEIFDPELHAMFEVMWEAESGQKCDLDWRYPEEEG